LLDPPPLLTGDDLIRAGVSPGPLLGALLGRIRVLQLDGILETSDDARRWIALREADGR
jgi:hypothetical protein